MTAIPMFEDSSRDPDETVQVAAACLDGLFAAIESHSDPDLISLASRVESLARQVGALQTRIAGEIDARSKGGVDESLAGRHGCRSSYELLERLTQAPEDDLRRRIRVDRATRPAFALTGEELPAAHPDLAAALEDGSIGVAAADHLRAMLDRVARRADPTELAAAEVALVEAACDTGERWTFAQLSQHAATWAAFLDQDGVEPDSDRAAKHRGVSLRPTRDGLYRLHGDLMPEPAGQLQRLLDAGGNPAVSFAPHPEDAAADEAWADGENVPDPRTPAQKRHDVFAAAIAAAARSVDLPSLGGAAPTLLVHVALEDLQSPTGFATIDGIDVPVPAATAHRIACTGAVQKVVFDRNGRLVRLGSRERVFNAHQRKAITARDGGCVIRGCTVPASWCEIHHVTDHAKGGRTHTDNGVLLCWWHHHHLENSGWRIRMNKGVPEVAAPPWIDHRGVYRPAVSALTRQRARGRARPPV